MEKLCEALSLRRGDIVAFVGGGGKTSAVLCLANELSEAGWRVVVTTTTKVGSSMPDTLDTVLADRPGWRRSLARAVGSSGRAFLAAGTGPTGKYEGLTAEGIAGVLSECGADTAIVEADGARQRPIKLPAEHEPAMPPDATLVVPVAGLDALGRPPDRSTLHRAGLMHSAPAWRGLRSADRLTPSLVGTILGSQDGGRKSVPPGARVIPLLNKADLVAGGRVAL
ncbi:MAG: putative selenium-dependent hydroxylase accessory protein YqeC, partial [Candidatus Eisenbacteria bacterium]|nr:putative selenium-dependent hydroxylase accessory protein YqeC [Candidatus Eisenbacteria bacterium]